MSWTNFVSTKRVVLAVIALLSLGLSRPLWAQTEITIYPLGNDGVYAIYGGLAADSKGALYGNSTAAPGGAAGLVFQLVPPTEKGGAWTLNTIHTFSGNNSDGAFPWGTPAVDSLGNVYGTTDEGGLYGTGAIYELSPPATEGGSWTETLIASVLDANFQAGVTFDPAGNMYAVTGYGGVLQLVPQGNGSWVTNTLCQLPNLTLVHNGLTLDKAGRIYGLSATGGLHGYGYAFSIQPPLVLGGNWRGSDLYDFTGGADGGTPWSSLTLASGVLYGTASSGGAAGFGDVFSLTPPTTGGQKWSESVLYSFQGGSDGSAPQGGVTLGSRGTLWGTTTGYPSTQYPGTVYKLTPPTQSGEAWTETVIHNFDGLAGGAMPMNNLLLLHGSFYGTTYDTSAAYEVLPK